MIEATTHTVPRESIPVLTRYDGPQLHRISLPIGGIGTGTIGLGGRGDLRDFEVGNRPAKGFRPSFASFAIRAHTPDAVHARVLEGPLDDADFDGPHGSPAANQGMPRFRRATFATAYPFACVTLTDPDMPVVQIEAFNPFIPTDAAASSLPVAIMRFRVQNATATPMRISIAASLANFIGANGTSDDTGTNTNTFKESDDVAGILMTAPGLDDRHEAGGSICLSTLRNGDHVSHCLAWPPALWTNPYLEFWDDFVADGRLDDKPGDWPRPVGSITNEMALAPDESRTLTFMLTWSFPNRRAWRSDSYDGIEHGQYTDDIVGNRYSIEHSDPWATAQEVATDLPALEARTRRVVEAIIATDAPLAVREAALFNLSTLRSATLFRTADGQYYGWEGVTEREGSCFGTCTHVWSYEFATSLLFPQIARSFRATQYLRSTDERGLMAFRTSLPADRPELWRLAAADGQMATLVHLYLDVKLSGDLEWLHELWPKAKKSLEFAWIDGGWDADRDGVMEGCQHNTMDVEYYGPNPQMQSWYLAALRSGEELAKLLGDCEFAKTCRDLFRRGSAWTDANLFNGSYYEQHIIPIPDPDTIADGLRLRDQPNSPAAPLLQVGKGVLIDQLVGQYAARMAGLGPILDLRNVRTAADHIFAANHRDSMWGHFNHLRGYAVDDDAGVVMASYPPGTRHEQPFPYFNEVMSGFEYTLALNHIQDGDRATGLRIIEDIRRRHDGRRRNPFDEAECGRHYARAMASWSGITAWHGIDWDARTGVLHVDRIPKSTFWSTGWAAGELSTTPHGTTLTVFEGLLPIRTLNIAGTSHNIHTPLKAGMQWSSTA